MNYRFVSNFTQIMKTNKRFFILWYRFVWVKLDCEKKISKEISVVETILWEDVMEEIKKEGIEWIKYLIVSMSVRTKKIAEKVLRYKKGKNK